MSSSSMSAHQRLLSLTGSLDITSSALSGLHLDDEQEDLPQIAHKKPPAATDDDPDYIIHCLRGLPLFPSPPSSSPTSVVPEAAFLVSGGPNCLIRELALPPRFHDSAPTVIHEIIEQVNKCQVDGEYEQALERLSQVHAIWGRKQLWRELQRHADELRDSGEEVKKTFNAIEFIKAADERVAAAEAARVAAESEAARAREEAARAAAAARESEEVEEREERPSMSRQNSNPKAVAAPHHARSASGVSSIPALSVPDAADAPSVSLEEELQYSLFYHNLVGSIELSAERLQAALVSFWAARLCHDRYGAVREAQRAKEAREQEEQERAERRRINGGEEESDDEEDGQEDLSKKPLERRGSLSDPLFHLPIFPLNPFVLVSPALALTWANIATVVQHLKKPAIALNCFYASHQMRLLCVSPSSDEFVDVASGLNNIGVCLSALARFEEAYNYYMAAEELMKHRFHPLHPRLNTVRNNLEKVRTRRHNIKTPTLVSILDTMARARQQKLDEAEAKRLAKEAKANKKKGIMSPTSAGSPAPPGSAAPASAGGSRPRSSAGGARKGDEEYKSLDQYPEYFSTANDPVRLPGHMPLRHWSVEPSAAQQLQMEFGAAKGKSKATKKKK